MADRRTGYYVAGRDWPAMGSGIPLEELYRGLEGITEGGPAPMSDQPAEVTVPQAAVAAALSARDESQSMTDEGLTRDMLEAAAPHIAEAAQEKAVAVAVAAERERIAALAEREQATYRPIDTVPGVYDGRPFKPGPDPLGDPFADLIRTGRASAACQCQQEDCRYCQAQQVAP